jgi:oligopeptide/dipeptide ABC transporter ATP-binding protein
LSLSASEPATGTAPAAPGDVVLDVRDLVKHFPVTRGVVLKRTIGQVQAVDGVSFQLRRGETLGVVGESGCGKSTLAKILVGLERPTAGQVLVDGADIGHAGGKELKAVRRKIQLIFQDPYTAFDPRMTVGALVAEPFTIHRDVLPRDARRRRVQELLEVVGLNPDHVNRYPHQFSGGQRQRIGIARALALRPDIIVCDEPVSALDVSVQAQVINLLEELQDEFGVSYVFIGHDLGIVRHIADRIAVMYLGKIVETGTEAEVYDHATHPYTQALLSAVPPPDPTIRDRREHIVLEGDVPSPVDPPSGCRFRTRCWKAAEVCAAEVPPLVPRQAAAHPSACHFAEQLPAVAATTS